MKKVTLTVICRDDDAEYVEHEFANSELAQLGIYSWGTSIEDCTEEEKQEVIMMTPPEILNQEVKGI